MTKRVMTRALPFTAASLARAIRGVEQSGRYVVGFRVSDATLIIADKPLDPASLQPKEEQDDQASKWADQLA